jgi:hypothetical protein
MNNSSDDIDTENTPLLSSSKKNIIATSQTVDEVLSRFQTGFYHYRLAAVAGLALMSDAMVRYLFLKYLYT